MTPEEHHLAQLLRDLVPEPPRTITVDDLAVISAAAPARRPRAWVAGMTALTVATIAALVVALGPGIARNRSAPVTGPDTAAPSATPHSSPSPTPRPSPTAHRPAAGPWQSHVITPGVFDLALLAGPDSLYAVSGAGLMRIDPGSGAVIARAPVSLDALPPVFAGGGILLATITNPSSALVQRFDPRTLRTLGSTTVSFTGVNDGAFSLVAPAGVDHVYLGAGNSIAVLDATTLAVQRRLPVSGGAVVALAPSTDGAVLYVGVQAGYEFALQTLDPASGRPTSSQPIFGSLLRGAEMGVVASKGGLWVATAGGHSESLWFAPGGRLTTSGVDLPGQVGQGGGGIPAYVTLAGGVAWIGGPNAIACADPVTGEVRASADIREPIAGLVGVVTVGGRWFAVRLGPTGGIVEFTPPNACRAE